MILYRWWRFIPDYFDRKRRSKEWRIVQRWTNRCVDNDGNLISAEIIVIGEINGLGKKRISVYNCPSGWSAERSAAWNNACYWMTEPYSETGKPFLKRVK